MKIIIKFWKYFILSFLTLIFSGCLGNINQITCNFKDNSDKCYQWSAIQEGNPEICKKIKNKTESITIKMKDYCYYKIATNTKNYNMCGKTSGKDNIYTKTNCILNIIENYEDPKGCDQFSKSSFDYSNCISIIKKFGM